MKRRSMIAAITCSVAMLAILGLATAPFAAPEKTPSAASKAPAAAPGRVSIAYVTNPSGAGYYSISIGQAQVVAQKSNIDLSVQPASGSVVVATLVQEKEAMIGIAAAQTLHDAMIGAADYHGKKHPALRALQAGHDTLFGIVTHEATGIKSIPDLKKKRFTCNILTSNIGRRLGALEIEAYGLSIKDVRALKAEYNDAAIANLADGKTDAVTCTLAGSKMEELGTKVKPLLLPFDPAKAAFVQQTMPAMFSTVSKKTGPIPAGIPVMGTPAVLFAHQELDEATAYTVTKALVENAEELKPIHRDFLEWTPKNAVKKIPIPYHPGAIKYYKEAGLWSAEMDKLQAELLKAEGK